MEALILQFQSDLNKAIESVNRSNHSLLRRFVSQSGLGKSTLYKYQNEPSKIPPAAIMENFYKFIYDGQYKFSELPVVVQEYILNNKKIDYLDEPVDTSLRVNQVLKKSHMHRLIYLFTIDSTKYAPTRRSIISSYGFKGLDALKDLTASGAIVIKKDALLKGKKRADLRDGTLVKQLIMDMIFDIDKASKEVGADKYVASTWSYQTVTLSEDEIELVNREIQVLNDKIKAITENSNGSKVYSIAIIGNTLNK